MDKKVIAREGLITIGTFFSVFIYFCLENRKLDSEYLFEDVPKPFLILYGSYLVVRFLIWSFNILKVKESKAFKYIIIAICVVLCIYALVFFSCLYMSHKNEKLNKRITEMSDWISVLGVAEILSKKYPDNENYQDAYKWIEAVKNEIAKKHKFNILSAVPVEKRGNYSIEEIRALDKKQLVTLLEYCCRNYNIKCVVLDSGSTIYFVPKNPKDFKGLKLVREGAGKE
jgi:hypothetical protein